MKRKTNKAKEEAWSQTAHAPDGEQPGPEASDTSGQSVPKSKFRKKSQQEQAAAAKLRMESQGEKLEQAREKLAKQKPPKKPGPVKRIGRVASGSVHSFVHGKIFEVEQENVGTEGAHLSLIHICYFISPYSPAWSSLPGRPRPAGLYGEMK